MHIYQKKNNYHNNRIQRQVSRLTLNDDFPAIDYRILRAILAKSLPGQSHHLGCVWAHESMGLENGYKSQHLRLWGLERKSNWEQFSFLFFSRSHSFPFGIFGFKIRPTLGFSSLEKFRPFSQNNVSHMLNEHGCLKTRVAGQIQEGITKSYSEKRKVFSKKREVTWKTENAFIQASGRPWKLHNKWV